MYSFAIATTARPHGQCRPSMHRCGNYAEDSGRLDEPASGGAMSTVFDLELVSRRLDELIPYAQNPRKNDRAVARMCESIREFGFKVPILATSKGEIIDGHLRLKAAQR